jgi:hypothetical protein
MQKLHKHYFAYEIGIKINNAIEWIMKIIFN